MKFMLLMLLAALSLSAADNTLTREEKKQGWQLLFDGKTMKGWRDPAKMNVPGDAWAISDGAIHTVLKPRIEEDLFSEKSYRDFELLFDWKITPKGNTGLKYRIQRTVFMDSSKAIKGPHGFEGLLGREMAAKASDRAKLPPDAKGNVYSIGFEFQLIDDETNRDALSGAEKQTGALYSMIPASQKAARPAGEWNTSKLVVKGQHVEHWINGVKVLDASLDDPRVKAMAAKRWGPAPEVREALSNPKPEGPITLQHHGNLVWFKNLKIRELK
jgi:hypothetical protein